jgi:hypothetical protein
MKRQAVGSKLETLVLPAVLGVALLSGCGPSRANDDDDDGGGKTLAGSTSSTSGSGGATSGPSGAGGSTGSGPPQACTWPEGPYGNDTDDTVPDNFTWQGYPANSDAVGSVSIQDYFDCDGSRGVNAVLLITSQFNCPACSEESRELEGLMNGSWEALGIEVAVLILDNPTDGYPSIQDAEIWKQEYGLESVAVVIDPNFLMVPGTSVGTPMQSVIDPRTMRVHYRVEGLPPTYSVLESLAAQNASQ